MADQWGRRDLLRLQSAVLTTEQVVPTMEKIINSVTQIGKDIADLGARISGNVGNAVLQTDVTLLHGKTDTAANQVMQTSTTSTTKLSV